MVDLFDVYTGPTDKRLLMLHALTSNYIAQFFGTDCPMVLYTIDYGRSGSFNHYIIAISKKLSIVN